MMRTTSGRSPCNGPDAICPSRSVRGEAPPLPLPPPPPPPPPQHLLRRRRRHRGHPQRSPPGMKRRTMRTYLSSQRVPRREDARPGRRFYGLNKPFNCIYGIFCICMAYLAYFAYCAYCSVSLHIWHIEHIVHIFRIFAYSAYSVYTQQLCLQLCRLILA